MSIRAARRQNPFCRMDQLLSMPIILTIFGVPEGYFPCFQKPGTCVYPLTDESVQRLHILLFEVTFNNIMRSMPKALRNGFDCKYE